MDAAELAQLPRRVIDLGNYNELDDPRTEDDAIPSFRARARVEVARSGMHATRAVDETLQAMHKLRRAVEPAQALSAHAARVLVDRRRQSCFARRRAQARPRPRTRSRRGLARAGSRRGPPETTTNHLMI